MLRYKSRLLCFELNCIWGANLGHVCLVYLSTLSSKILNGADTSHSCLRNVVTLFQQIEKERAWRKANGRPEGFETLNVRKPIGTSR
jgi:hypothetical protein